MLLWKYLALTISYSENLYFPFENFTDFSAVAILSTNFAQWSELMVSQPTILRSFENHREQDIPVDLYVIDLVQDFPLWSWEMGKKLIRTAFTRFVFTMLADDTEKSLKKVESIKQGALKLGLCHVEVMILNSSDDFTTVTLQDHCSGLGSDKVVLAEEDNCKANVAFIDLPPNTIPDGDNLLGYEGMILGAVAGHLGIQIEKYINYHEAGFGSFTPPTLLQGDILKRNVFAAIGGIYPFYERQIFADSVFSCASMQVIWSVPSKAGPAKATWFIILVSEFSITVWISALVLYIALVAVCPAFENSTVSFAKYPLYILALLLGQSQEGGTNKGFQISVMFFGLLFTNYYLAVMSSKLTLPAEIPELKTMRELANTNLDFVSTPFIRKVVESVGQNTYSTGKMELSKKCRAVSDTSQELLHRIADTRDTAYARHDNFVKYIYSGDSELKDKVHFMEEPVTEFYPIVMLPKHSCLRKRVQLYFRRLCETGIGLKWFKDLTTLRNDREKGGVRQLAVEHIRGFLLLLFFGWFVAACAFLFETFALIKKFAKKAQWTRGKKVLKIQRKIRFATVVSILKWRTGRGKKGRKFAWVN